MINSGEIEGWISSHPEMDKLSTYDPEEYILSYVTPFPNKSAVLVVDINKERVKESLENIDVTQGAIIAFVTAEGKEIVVKEEENTTDIVFYNQEFYQNSLLKEEVSGYLELIEKQVTKEKPNSKLIKSNLKNALIYHFDKVG